MGCKIQLSLNVNFDLNSFLGVTILEITHHPSLVQKLAPLESKSELYQRVENNKSKEIGKVEGSWKLRG